MKKKIAAAAILMCAVMVLVAGAPLVTADTHHIVKGAQGPRASAQTWTWQPSDSGIWTGHIVNSGLRSLVVDVTDVTNGAATSILHQRIRFAVYPTDTLDTNGAPMRVGHVYNITATPNGARGTSCTVDDVFAITPPPVAAFTATVSGADVTVDGSASSDTNPGATIQAWGWEWGDMSATGSGMTATHTYAATGTYTITLTVLSSTGLTGSVSHDVSPIVTVDTPPTASFTYSTTSWTVTVDGSGSTDDHGVVSYDWNWGDGSAHGSGVTATHEYSASNTYTVTLTVADAKNQQGVQSQQVKVIDNPPTAAFTPTTNALVVSVDASASSDDYGIVSFDWNWGDGSAHGSGKTATHAYMAGTYTITLTVADVHLQTGMATAVVNPTGPPPPIASFTATVSGASVSVDGSASTGSSGIASYSWNWGDSIVSTGVTSSHTYVTTNTYTITLTVTDALGQKGTTTRSVSVVNNAIPPTPYTVYGTVYAADGVTPVVGCAVTITDMRTGTTLIDIVTDDTGFYAGDISVLYQLSGDTIVVHAMTLSGQTGSGTGVVSGTPYLGIDVILSP